MKKTLARRFTAIILSLCAIIGVSACGNSLPAPAPSRIGVKDPNQASIISIASLDGMADLSKQIIAGMVMDQKTEHMKGDKDTKYVLNSVRVLATPKGSIKPGTTVTVTQIVNKNEDGSDDVGAAKAILKKHEVVMLFISPISDILQLFDVSPQQFKKNAPDDMRNSYILSAGSSGIYMLSHSNQFQMLVSSNGDLDKAENVEFSRFMISGRDNLPRTITINQVRKANKKSTK